MAFVQVVATLVILLVSLPALARATVHVVGDGFGWKLNFDYAAWAKGRNFHVGDKLVFRYPPGNHNVFKVNGPDFQACNVPHANEAMTSGYDVINLATPGRKWYICGKDYGNHCRLGQRLFITVYPTTWIPPPAWKAPVARQPTQHVVGDGFGWNLNFDYAAWAKRRVFKVGDTLVFKYTVGYHNVFKVSGPEFNGCKVPPENEALTTGYDVIKLATPGSKWYICGKAYGKHCWMGQRLFINVLP